MIKYDRQKLKEKCFGAENTAEDVSINGRRDGKRLDGRFVELVKLVKLVELVKLVRLVRLVGLENRPTGPDPTT